MKLRRLRFASPLALVLAAALATACGGGQDRGGRVTFQVFGDPDETAVYREIAQAFTQKTGVEVQLVALPDRDSHLAKLTTGFGAKQPPDVFLLNYRNFGSYASRGVLEPVGPRLKRSTTVNQSDLYPQATGAFTTGQTLQCLPHNASSLVVYYNRDLFEGAGAAPPRAGWTYTDFRRTARRLRDHLARTQPDRAAAVGIDPGLLRFAPFVWGAGADVTDDDSGAPTRFAFDTPQARQGLDRFLAIYRERLAPSEVGVEAQGLDERFFDGRLGMYFSSRRDVAAFRQIEDFEWDVAPIPEGERAATVLHADALCLAKGPRAADAWRFAEFAGGPEGQRRLARAGRIVPSLRAVAESPDFLDPPPGPRASRVFLDTIPQLRRLPNTEQWPRIEDAASLAFKRAYYDELSVEAAIARVEAETAGLF